MRRGWSLWSVAADSPRILFFVIAFLFVGWSAGCGISTERGRVPTEIEALVGSISDDIAAERYDKVYGESSELWKRDATPEQSAQVLKALNTKLGKVESRVLNSASEQNNSGGPLKGHAFILTYQTRFQRGDAMETYTLIDEGGRWRLARYQVNSTALNQ
jgi:uncharacterized protein DUF4019